MIITTTTELFTILTEARQIGQRYNLSEICTEVVLFAMLDKRESSVYEKLKELKINIVALKQVVLKKINCKTQTQPPRELRNSNALEGLLFLNGCRNTSGLHLLKTILKHSNTAAARMLKSERISLDKFNRVIYSPVTD